MLGRVTRRADYLAANRARRAPTPGFVLLVRPRPDGDAAMRVGITVSGKVGNAVIRNRMKRRFRALVRDVLPRHGIIGADHVLIGRQSGIERDFNLLAADLRNALHRSGKKTICPEPVEGMSSSSSSSSSRMRKKGRPSTSSGGRGGRDGMPPT